MKELFDVLKVDMATHKIEVVAVLLSARNAEAVENMGVSRCGCDEFFFVTAPAGTHSDGEEWQP